MNSSTAFKRPGQALATLAVVLTSGCASPVLQSMATNEPGASGLVYALPKAQILVQASRRKVDAAEVDAAKKDADDTAAVSKTAASSAKEAEQQLKALETEVTKAEELKVGADALPVNLSVPGNHPGALMPSGAPVWLSWPVQQSFLLQA